MSHNRKDFLAEALNSLLQQKNVSFEVIISDNSTNNTVSKWFSENYSIPSANLKYIRRKQTLPVLDHHNQIISEVTAPYFMMFHDDDVLEPRALEILLDALEKNPTASAVCGNAGVINERTVSTELFAPCLNENIIFNTAEDFAEHYLLPEKGHVPFPGYLYRSTLVKNLHLDFKQGRKNADVSFLVKTCQKGQIHWLADKTMYYRRHKDNGSINVDLKAIFSLCRFLKKHTHTDTKLIETYKIKHYYLSLKQNPTKLTSLRRKKILKSATYGYLLRHPQIILKSLLRRLLR